MDIFCKQRGGTEGGRQQQLALGQGHCSTPDSGMLQVLPFPQLTCTEGQRGAQKAKQHLCYLYAHTLFILSSISSSSSSADKTQHRDLMDRAISLCAALTGVPHCKVPPTPQKGQSCFTHLIFGRTGSAVTFPTNKKTSQIRGFTLQEVLHLH